MESLELRIFKEVANTKSITKAAEQMGYVQSNITAHIKKLEEELGTMLFIRHNKGVTLTQDGEKLLYQAEKILKLLDTTAESFRVPNKTLRIGTTQTIAGYVLPQFLMEYQKQFPDVTISVSTLQQDALETQLQNHLIDCVITNRSKPFAHAKLIHQWKEELMLIAPLTCRSLDDVKSFPIITNNIKTCPYRETLLSWWNEQAYEIQQIIEFDTVEAILNMVANEAGISLLPKSTCKNRKDIRSFMIKELQTTSIYMWQAHDCNSISNLPLMKLNHL